MNNEVIWQDLSRGNVSTDTISCLGCDKACHLADEKKEECEAVEYYLWPENNQFLVKGIKGILFDNAEKIIHQPVIFIDCNYHNLGLFLSDDWLDNFKGMRVILLADKIMTPVAHYWFYHDSPAAVVGAVMFHDDDDNAIRSKVKACFMGKVIRPEKTKAKLTDNEFILLANLYRGESPKRLAIRMGLSVKNIYVTKLRVENKLGADIHHLLI